MTPRSALVATCAAILLGVAPALAGAARATEQPVTPSSLTTPCTSSVGPGIPPPASVPSGLPGFHAAWYGQSGYMTLCPGDTSTATLAIYNSGSRGWVSGVLGEVAYLGTWKPSPGQDQPSVFGGDGTSGSPTTGWLRYNRVAIQPAPYVGPNQVAWFQFAVRAPTTPGSYGFYIRPLIEGAQWMEDYGIFWQITVPDMTEPAVSRAVTASTTKLLVNFSEAMKCSTDGAAASIGTGANYAITTPNGGAVAENITATPNASCTQASLALSNPLTLTNQYLVTVSNVQDRAGNTIGAAGRSASFTVAATEIYGLISSRNSTLIVRSENDTQSVGTVPSFVLDSEHRRVATWVTAAGVSELHVRNVIGGADTIVGRLPAGLVGRGLAWASDDGGFAVTAAVQGDAAALATVLLTIDITGGAAFRERYRLPTSTGPTLMPLGWQRARDLVAAYETGPGGYNFGYTVVQGGAAAQRYETPFEISGMEMSPDGSHVLGTWIFEDAVKVWPTDNFAAKTILASPSQKFATAHWWPRSPEVVYMVGTSDGGFENVRVERWDPTTGRRTVLFALPDSLSLGGQLTRPDGTAVLVPGPRSGATTWEVHDIATGNVATIQPESEVFLATAMLR
jgi:Big-like domain-containing protein